MEQKRTSQNLNHEHYIVGRLNALRKVQGWTVTELARRSKMDPSHLEKVFRGERSLCADEYLCICFALNVVKMSAFMPETLVRELQELSMRTPDGKPVL